MLVSEHLNPEVQVLISEITTFKSRHREATVFEVFVNTIESYVQSIKILRDTTDTMKSIQTPTEVFSFGSQCTFQHPLPVYSLCHIQFL